MKENRRNRNLQKKVGSLLLICTVIATGCFNQTTATPSDPQSIENEKLIQTPQSHQSEIQHKVIETLQVEETTVKPGDDQTAVFEEQPVEDGDTEKEPFEDENVKALMEAARIEALFVSLLTDTYDFGEKSIRVEELQKYLGTTPDGIYGAYTRTLHLQALQERALVTINVPVIPQEVEEAEEEVEEEVEEAEEEVEEEVEEAEEEVEEEVEEIEQETIEETTPPNTCSGFTCYPGYEGQYQNEIDSAVAELPAELRTALTQVTVINGCHSYSHQELGHCPYGVWDSAGWDTDGSYGKEWKKTIWISNRGFESGRLEDILTHEAAHAYSYNVLRPCGTWRTDAQELFGGEEQFADALTAYHNGASAFQNYRGTGTPLSPAEDAFIATMENSC